MSWVSIREYTEKVHISPVTARRHIQQGKIRAKKFGRNWFIFHPNHQQEEAVSAPHTFSTSITTEPLTEPLSFEREPSNGNLQSVIDFSSKALHHYLIMSEKLVAEKELRLQEKEEELREKKQALAELETYVHLLESEVERHKNKPEGWA